MKENKLFENKEDKKSKMINESSGQNGSFEMNISDISFQNLKLKSSYDNLKEFHVLMLNIINNKINLFEFIQPNRYLNPFQISFIKRIKEKYANFCPFSIFNNLNNTIKNHKSFFDPNSQNNYYNQNYFIYNNKINQNNMPLLFDNNNNNNLNSSKEKKFLNQKREREINDYEKQENIKVTIFNESQNEETKEITIKKRAIFQLSKKKYNHLKDSLNKEVKTPGRKKKNSGEQGTHNKFSKDNMMRKLKNKVMESARKLINKKIRDESHSEARCYREIRKIEGVYSQELNIKFNFWFYFQKLKDIFQFKMSSKYSKGGLDSNHLLIKRLTSNENSLKYPKTIQLFEMSFHQYYHDIFLGENKNWTRIFDIKEKDNKFQLDYFVNYSNLSKENDFLKYKNTIFNLAYNYEKFFLEKNPRLNSNKNSEKPNNVKEIIKYINNTDYQIIKIKFIEQASIYRPELKTFLKNYSLDNISELNFKISQNTILENYQNMINNKNEIEKKIYLNSNTSLFKFNSSLNRNFFRIEKIKNKNLVKDKKDLDSVNKSSVNQSIIFKY